MWKRLSVLWTVIRGDAKVLWHALRHPQSPGWLKLGVAGMVLYLLSPVDLIPDVLPIIGVVDDLIVIPLAMSWLIRMLPASVREAAQRRAKGEPASMPVVDEVR
jgi:uncharacterized membrane protein YkvA (DUF1232 family)